MRMSQGGQGDQGSQKSEGDGPEIIDFRGVSVQLMVDTLKAVEDGTAASGVRLYVALTDIGFEVKKGATIKRTGERRDGDLIGSVAYVAGFVTFSDGQVQEKKRSEWTVEDVAEHVVLAATRPQALIYLETIPDREDVGAKYQGAFVSQARACTFASLVAALVAHYEKKGVDLRKQFVWLDLFSANQPLLASPDSELAMSVRKKREDLLMHGLHVAIDKFDERVIFFDTWDNPTPLTRSWCVWEIYGSISMGKLVQPIFARGQDRAFLDVLLRDPDEIKQAFADIDTRNAQCFKAGDKAMIDAAIESQLKDGFTTLNAAILGGLRDWLTEIAHAAVAKANVGLAEDDEEAQYQYARVLHHAGYFLYDQAKYEEAVAYYAESLAIKKEVLGEQHPSVATTLNNIASVYQAQCMYEEALAYYGESLDIKKEVLGEQDPKVATTLNNIAIVHKALGCYEEALAFYEKALGIFKAKLGEQHPSVANTLDNMAGVYIAQGRDQKALAYFEEALRIRKAKLGGRHPDVAITITNIATVYDVQGRCDKALVRYEEALSIRRAKLGEQHPHVAATLNNMGLVYNAQGRYEKALANYEEALRISKKALGKHHPEVATTLCNIASVYKDHGKCEEALAYYEEALDIYKAKLDEKHPLVATALSLIGKVYSMQGRYDKALDLLKQSLEIRQEKLGERHGDVAKSLAFMAGVYCGQEQFDEALDFCARALDIAIEAMPARNTLVPLILHGTAMVHKAKGGRTEALRLFRQALDLRKDILGDAHPDTVATQAALDDLANDQAR